MVKGANVLPTTCNCQVKRPKVKVSEVTDNAQVSHFLVVPTTCRVADTPTGCPIQVYSGMVKHTIVIPTTFNCQVKWLKVKVTEVTDITQVSHFLVVPIICRAPDTLTPCPMQTYSGMVKVTSVLPTTCNCQVERSKVKVTEVTDNAQVSHFFSSTCHPNPLSNAGLTR